MKCLVTGGAGFIGSNLVKLLLREGRDIVVLDNLTTGYKQNVEKSPRVEFIEGDVRDAALVERLSADTEVIFHLAASVGNARSIEDPVLDSQINIIGTIHILEAARKNRVRKVVFSSSAGIFGQLKTLPISEDHSVEPDSPYGASKLGAEKLCLAYSKLYDLDTVALRYFNVYGINQRYDAYGNVIPIFAHRMLHGEPIIIFDDGEQTRDFVNVQDVALANYKASIAEGVSGPFNVASGTAVTINRLVDMMKEVCDIDPVIEYALPRKGDVRDSQADIAAAKAAFGYEPAVELEDGLAQYMDWARKEAG